MLQFRALYQLGEKTVRRMLQSGQLMPVKTPGGHWRIFDPGSDIVELTRRQAAELAATPFIRGCEVADLMGISERRVRRLAEQGKLRYQMRGSRRVYALAEIEDYMAQRHGGYRKARHSDVRPRVRRWAADTLAKTLRERGVTVPDFLQKEQWPKSPDIPV